jgi:hypothetical protein
VGNPFNRSGGEIEQFSDKTYGTLLRSFSVDIFDWNDVDFNDFTFNIMNRPQIVPSRKKVRRVKEFGIRITNNVLNEPFVIYSIIVHFRTSGTIKK